MDILIADDHALFRDTLQHYIQRAHPDYALHMASSLTEVLKLLRGKSFVPDLCLIDFRMPGMRGFESFQNLIKTYPLYSFAMMSGVAEAQDVSKILNLGISGFLPKTLPGRAMLEAIDKMLHGKKFIPYEDDGVTITPSYFAEARAATLQPARTGPLPKLTPREEDVLKLLCHGKSNKQIADDLGLQTVTVKLHIRGIFKKLDCDNRTRAVLRATEMGILH